MYICKNKSKSELIKHEIGIDFEVSFSMGVRLATPVYPSV
jgi:hypothetical protein